MKGWMDSCRRRILALALIFIVIFLLSGCGLASGGRGENADGDGRLRVVTTLFPYYDFVRQIAGDGVSLTLVIPAGMDSHSFEPTPADMRTIQNADLLICNGGAMEQWLSQVLDAVETGEATEVMTMMDYVDALEEELVEGMEDGGENHRHEGEDHSHGKEADPHLEEQPSDRLGTGETDSHEEEPDSHSRTEKPDADYVDHDGHETEIEYDEHIWTSPVNAMKIAAGIRDKLVEMDPAHEALYRQNADAYLKELAAIDAGFRQVSAHRKRNLIVVGDKFPFRYLAEEYRLDYRAAFSACSADTEPSARTIAYLIDKVKDEGIPVVYYLELSSHRVSEIIGEETGAQPLLLHSCHNVTRAQFDAGITYVELMTRNIENLRKGLDE